MQNFRTQQYSNSRNSNNVRTISYFLKLLKPSHKNETIDRICSAYWFSINRNLQTFRECQIEIELLDEIIHVKIGRDIARCSNGYCVPGFEFNNWQSEHILVE